MDLSQYDKIARSCFSYAFSSIFLQGPDVDDDVSQYISIVPLNEIISAALRHRHRHQKQTPDWGIAVCLSLLHAFRTCARCHVQWRPMLYDFMSSSTFRVQVCARSPLRRFQSHCGMKGTAMIHFRVSKQAMPSTYIHTYNKILCPLPQ